MTAANKGEGVDRTKNYIAQILREDFFAVSCFCCDRVITLLSFRHDSISCFKACDVDGDGGGVEW